MSETPKKLTNTPCYPRDSIRISDIKSDLRRKGITFKSKQEVLEYILDRYELTQHLIK